MLSGYCWPQSGAAGDVVDLCVSTDADTVDVTVVRVAQGETVVVEATVDGVAQAVPVDAAVHGCRWVSTLSIEIDPSWLSGFHLVRLSKADGETAEAFFVVRAPADRPGADTLLVLATTTYAAYNDWGGPSFYTGGHRSSLQRPLPAGFLDKPRPHDFRVARFHQLARADREWYFQRYSMWSAAAGWANWERLFVAWAERERVALDVATSLDLATDPGLLDGYGAYVSVGHDEYWSASMRDHLEGWVDRGGSAAFLSGNTAFWQIRLEGDDGAGRPTTVVGYKNDIALDPVMGTPDEPSATTMWSDPVTGRPENEMTGVSFTRGGYAHCRNAPHGSGGYTVWRPGHRVFDGLDLRAGDIVGAEPVVVGYECDGCDLQLRHGLPVATGDDGTPADFEVLATAPAHLWATEEGAPGLPDTYVGELNWVAERLGGADTAANRERFAHGSAVMGAFRRGRGEVFTVGCTDWAYGLDDPAVSRITHNVLNRPVGPAPAEED